MYSVLYVSKLLVNVRSIFAMILIIVIIIIILYNTVACRLITYSWKKKNLFYIIIVNK